MSASPPRSDRPQPQGAGRPRERGDRAPALVFTAAALLWLPQAGLLAAGIERIAADPVSAFNIWLITGVLGLGLLRAALDGLATRMAFRGARARLSRERTAAAEALANRSPLDTARPSSGQAASVLAEQAEAVVPYLARFRTARLKVTIVPVAILLCVVPFSWTAALVLLVAAPVIPVFMALIGWRAKAASEAHLAELGDMNGLLLDRLRGLATIRSLGAVGLVASSLRDQANALRGRTMAVLRIAFLTSAVLELFAALGVAMVAVYVGFHLLGALEFGAWGAKLSLGEGLFILLLAPAFFEPLRELSAVWHDRAAGEAALSALADLDRDGPPLLGREGGAADGSGLTTSPALVRLRGLRFAHAGGAPVFSNLTLDIRPGEHVAIFGPSGSGKSTLLGLIAGLARANAGLISIDGTVLDGETAARLRTRMAWIGQKPHIFAGSVAANVAMGRPGIGSEEVEEALRRAALDPAVVAPQRQVGENGRGLSGGETVRLALARTAATPGIDLILADEPTAHLDSETARAIADDLIAFAKGRTLIVATHDPVLAARMDRIVRLDDTPMEAAA